ncbi:MAG: ankyrin repeat domain-containing protein [Gammaproteobacteria bacterium]|nr:ankyrin repeat domain-containing protein [Gammaproteobacteria bacterium]
MLRILPDLTFEKKFPLHAAANSGNLEKIKSLLILSTHLESSDDKGSTPLHYAAQHGYADIAALLLANNANIHHQDKAGDTPLHAVAYCLNSKKPNLSTVEPEPNHEAIVQMLCAKGALVNSKNYDGMTPLHFLAMNTDEEINSSAMAKLLFHFGADVKVKNKYNETPLHLAVQYNSVQMIELLINSGADPFAISFDNRTPMSMAYKKATPAIAILIEQLRQPLSLMKLEKTIKTQKGTIAMLEQRVQDLEQQLANSNSITPAKLGLFK